MMKVLKRLVMLVTVISIVSGFGLTTSASYPYGEPLNSNDELIGRDSVDLLARMVYGEAMSESFVGKEAVAMVAYNRKRYNDSEFGGNTYEGVLLHEPGFDSMQGTIVLQPDLNSGDWESSLQIARNMPRANPIGKCLWFVKNNLYSTLSRINSEGNEEFKFNSSPFWKLVVEKQVIGNHTFFRLEGYD
ncbi:cell wall hydrolase [Vallitalea sp.]|uniref:cell wall hydrolase n=1 Tax=Vallitalea sp. TaxID=1882829 RepID=UPI0025E07D91|nr:cell wall hydrolase [Vallitalea sp.]MCT4686783.1 cell wall hydrolase [Vallitalea sp.]